MAAALTLGGMVGAVHAQHPDDSAEGAGSPNGNIQLPGADARGMPVANTDCGEAQIIGGTTHERAAACAIEAQEYVSARTWTEKALEEDPKSFRAHMLMGAVQHMGEGNLPKALFHLEQAEELFIEAYGVRPNRGASPWPVYHRTLRELVWVNGEMDHHVTKIRYVDALRERLGLNYEPLKSWPLMKLKRFEEAEAVARRSIDSGEPWNQLVGRTALCAVQSEQRKRYEAYEACQAAAKPILNSSIDGAIELSNAAAAAEEVFRFDEAERMYLESARRRPEGAVNPWGRLVRLYIRQGRFGEALSAWRQMRKYRASRPGTYLDQQDQSEAELLGVEVMLMAGRVIEAEKVTRRTVQRPDRQGTSSADAIQNETGAAIMDRVAKLSAARFLEEEASISSWWDALKLRAEAAQLRFDAWSIGRRASELLSEPERLVTSLRPECPGSVEGPAWLDIDIVQLVGPGVAMAALADARAIEVLPEREAESIFGVHEAEAHYRRGALDDALATVERTLDLLPPYEMMLRARMAAIAARASERNYDYEAAKRYYLTVVRTDPALIRRLGLRLPVRLTTDGGDAEVMRAADMLAGSPRFREADWGFVLQVGLRQISLMEDDGSLITSAAVRPGRADSVEASARRIARTAHHELLVPDIDLTQADLRSIDVGLGTGGKASEQVKDVLNEVMSEPR